MKTITIYILLLLVTILSYGQEKDQLIDKRNNTLNQIDYTNKLLEENISQKKKSLNNLLLINKRIELREDVIENMDNEISLLEDRIYERSEIIDLLKEDLILIKSEYEKLILAAYKNKLNTNFIYFILASDNINTAYKRIKYYKAYSNYRKEQIRLIKAIQETLAHNIIKLEEAKEEKLALKNNKSEEIYELEKERGNRKDYIVQLKKEERTLKKKIEENRILAERLSAEIRKIIEEEAKKDKLYNVLTPAEKLISSNFVENKGRMPWPTKHGIVTGKFGIHDHPVLRGNKINNNGIDITTIKGSEVQCMYEGVVSRVISILGANYTVIIRHGNFLTLYQNLEKVYVKQGDTVILKQPIGTIFSDPDTGESVLHFEIWKEFDKMNPEDWLSRY